MTSKIEPTLHDLEWLVRSPFLVDCDLDFLQAGSVASVCWLEKLTKSLEQIPDEIIQSRKPPIGRYFERLVGFWLASQNNITNLNQNIIASQDKLTIGEFDFLFEVAPQSYHLELAVKFYLGTNDRRKLSNWHGPMARDGFDQKLEKLNQHQLLLSQTKAGKAALKKVGMVEVVTQKFVKGRLFHPFDHWLLGSFEAPAGVNPLHDKGWWVYESQMEKLIQSHPHRWLVLEKPNWFAQAYASNMDIQLSSAQLKNYVGDLGDKRRGPVLIAAFDISGQELHRGFIQPDSWPNA